MSDFSTQIAAGADDGHAQDGASINTTATYSRLGNYSFSVYGTWLRFANVTIAKGATVSDAHLHLVGAGGGAGSVLSAIWCVDEDDHAAPTTIAEWNTDHGIHDGETKTDWDFSGTASLGAALTSANFSAHAQHVFARASWASGNDLGVHLDDDGSASTTNHQAFATIEDTTYAEPDLDIVYTTITAHALVGAVTATSSVTGGELAQDWYNADWNYRVKVTVLASKVDADLTGFPVYVDLNDLPAGFHTHCNQTDARDIRVTTSDGETEVPREVVSYAAASDTGELWFKGDVDGDTNTDFYIYYGNAAATEPAADSTYGSENVWDANYKMVWHLPNGSTLGAVDSSTNDNDGTLNATPTAAAGQINGGARLTATSSQSISRASLVIPTTGTLSVWWKPTAYNAITPLFHSRQTTPAKLFDLYPYSGTLFGGWYQVANDHRATWTISGISNDTWHYVTLTWTNGGTTEIRVDGVSKATTTSLDATWDTSAITAYLGKDDQTPAYGNDTYDEVRLSSVVRAATWISTEYNNQSAPGDFYTVGDEVTSVSAWPLQGAVEAAASVVGGLKVAHKLAGAVSAAGAVQGGLTAKQNRTLPGTVAAAASVQGSLKIAHRLAGAVQSGTEVGSVAQPVKVGHRLQGAASPAASVAGGMKIAHSLGVWPKVRSSATSKNTSETKNHTVTLPSAVQAGDLLVVVYGENGSDAATFPAGWSKTLDSAGDLHLTIATKTADGTEGGTNITVTSVDAHRSQHIAYAVQHASGTLVSAVASGENANPNPPSVTAGTPTNTLVVAAEIHATSSAASAYPSGYTEGQNTVTGNSTAIASAAMHVTAGSENPGTFTIPASAAWKAGSLLIPAAVPVAASSSVSGVLDVQVYKNLAGAVVASSSVQGGLKVGHDLDGAVVAAGAVAGELDTTRQIVGAVSAAATVEGSLSLGKDLAGAVQAAAQVEGVVNAWNPNLTFRGAVAAASTVQGTLATPKSLAGAAGSSTTVAGSLKVSHPLTGAVTASSTISGAVAVNGQMAGTVAAASTVAGSLAVAHQIAGTVAAGASLTGDIELEHELGGVIIIPDSAVAGDLKLVHQAAGAVVAAVSVQGALAVVKQMSGTVGAATTVAAVLRPGRQLIGAASAAASVSGLIRLGCQLRGAITPSATVVGRLMVIGQIGHAAVSHTLATVATLTDTSAAAATATDTLAAVATLTETGDP